LEFVEGIEGSSFATPIVTGKIGNYFLSPAGGNQDLNAIYNGINVQTGATNLTVGGKFVKE